MKNEKELRKLFIQIDKNLGALKEGLECHKHYDGNAYRDEVVKEYNNYDVYYKDIYPLISNIFKDEDEDEDEDED